MTQQERIELLALFAEALFTFVDVLEQPSVQNEMEGRLVVLVNNSRVTCSFRLT